MEINYKEFSKLYKIPIPYPKEGQYYIDIIKSNKVMFPDLDLKLSIFNDFCFEYPNIKDMWIRSMGKMIEIVKNSSAYDTFINASLDSFDKTETFEVYPNSKGWYLKFDVRQANYTCLKEFDFNKKLPKTWEELCHDNNIHPVFIQSKSFREIVFGNLNPKRNQKIQYSIFIENFLKTLIGFKQLPTIKQISHDEVIFVFKSTKELLEFYNSNLIQNQKVLSVFKPTICTETHIEKDIYVETHYDSKMNMLGKKLCGVPGNQFYIYYKKYILCQTIEDRDLYFINDNKLAKWVL